MRYANIKYNDSANGAGVRTSLFVSGCSRHCEDCFNSEAWNFLYGEEYTPEVERQILDSIAPDHISGLSVLGGEPLEPANRAAVLNLLKNFREHYPKKDIWLFTGYRFEDLLSAAKLAPELMAILSFVDVLKDGEYIKELHDVSLQFRGSRNQRLIDVPKSLECGKVICWVDEYK